MLLEKKRIEMEILGGHLVYPGHPLAVALVITHAFPDYEAAFARSEFGWPQALSSEVVGGAGGAVYNGLEVLRQLRVGEDSAEVARLSKRAWESEARPEDQMAAGQRQADGVLDALVARVATWGAGAAIAPSA